MIRKFSVLKTQTSISLLKHRIILGSSEIIKGHSRHVLREDIKGIGTVMRGKKTEDMFLYYHLFEKVSHKLGRKILPFFQTSENLVKRTDQNSSEKKFMVSRIFKEFNTVNSGYYNFIPFCKDAMHQRTAAGMYLWPVVASTVKLKEIILVRCQVWKKYALICNTDP